MAAPRKAAAAKTTTRKTAASKTTRKAPAKRAARKAAPRKTTSKPARRAARKTAPPEERRQAGRPPLLEVQPELQSKVVTFVRSGAFPERAATAVGISERTHYAWMARGRDELEQRETAAIAGDTREPQDQMYVDYATAIDRAVAEAEMLLLGNALKGGATGGASMQILERRFRDRWGAKAAPAPSGPAPTTTAPATPLDMLEQRRQEREREQAAR
jgi:hypothetical protein